MLTKKEQVLLLELLLNKKMKKSEQKIYNSVWFYETISKLKKFGLVDSKTINKKSEKVYFLTFPKGWVRANVIAMDENTPEKYNGLSQEFRILL